jgi:hypothetical protein
MDNLQGFNFENRYCLVCLKRFQGGDNVRLLPCGYVFHMGCTTQWLTHQLTCPHCKSPLKFARDFKVKFADSVVEQSSTVPESINDDNQPILNSNPPDYEVEIHIPPPVPYNFSKVMKALTAYHVNSPLMMRVAASSLSHIQYLSVRQQ